MRKGGATGTREVIAIEIGLETPQQPLSSMDREGVLCSALFCFHFTALHSLPSSQRHSSILHSIHPAIYRYTEDHQ